MGERLAKWVSDVADRVFGPVFTLDATRVGRRFSTFLIRWLYLLVLLGILWAYMPSLRDDSYGGRVHPSALTRFAEEFFWVYSVTQFFLLAAITPSLTAGCITDEKERKTLHFLLATDLSGREIIFGKLASRMGAMFTLVLAGLPIIALLQLFGGIEPRLLLVNVSMTIASIFSLSALGVAASVLLPRTRDAVVLAYALPVGYLFVSSYFMAVLRRTTDPAWRDFVNTLASGNPLPAANAIRRDTGDDIPTAALWYVAFHVVVALVGIAFAAWRIRASVRSEGAAASTPKSRPARMLAWLLGQRSEARKHTTIGDDPIYWREVHVEPNSSVGVFHRFMTGMVLFAVVFPFVRILWDFLDDYDLPRRGRWYSSSWSPWKELQAEIKLWVCGVTCGLGILMLLRATIRGASAVAEERDRDTWVSLLATPLSCRKILSGKWAGCVLGQKDLLILLGIVWAIGIVTFSVNPFALAFTGLALAVYLRAFAWFGISCSAAASSSRAAIAKAVPMALLMGGGYWLGLGCCCAGIGSVMRGADSDVIVIPAMFTVGTTPPFVLALLPAIDTGVLKDMTRHSEGTSSLLAGVVGLVVGAGGWWWFAEVRADVAHDDFARSANRDEEIPGTRPRKNPRRTETTHRGDYPDPDADY